MPSRKATILWHLWPLNGWIEAFLTGRTQRVVVDGEASAPASVLSGVPQGSVLGPLLFLLFVNDITGGISSSVHLFADDCLIYREINPQEDSVKLQKDLDNLVKWSDTWQMSFNTSKCYFMTISLTGRNVPITDYSMDGTSLAVKTDNPYLGVQIENKLS